MTLNVSNYINKIIHYIVTLIFLNCIFEEPSNILVKHLHVLNLYLYIFHTNTNRVMMSYSQIQSHPFIKKTFSGLITHHAWTNK